MIISNAKVARSKKGEVKFRLIDGSTITIKCGDGKKPPVGQHITLFIEYGI